MVTVLHQGSWKIAVYGEGAQHPRPHFHIEGRGYRCSIDIATGVVIIGDAPKQVLRFAEAWRVNNRTLLMAKWQELNR